MGVDLAKAGDQLETRARDAASLALLLAELGLSAEALGRAGEGRVDLLYAALRERKPVRSPRPVIFPSAAYRAALVSAWTEGILVGLLASGERLSCGNRFDQIIEAGRSLDALSEERGAEGAASSLGLRLEPTFEYASQRAGRLIGGGHDANAEAARLGQLAPSFMLDGVFCGLMLRRLDQAGGPFPSA